MLAIDLFCGLGGWTEGLLQEGYRVIGFDIERHQYGEARYPAQLVIQDVLTIHGSQFKEAALIVASPPCQAYSYRAMPWKRAKALPPPDNTLFEACFRIQREACEAAGHHIPLVVENVCGAQKWVGRARWHYGSFYLWGDVPALMPITRRVKNGTGGSWLNVAHNTTSGHWQNPVLKVPTDRICDCGHCESEHGFNPDQPCNLCSCINPVYGSRRRTDVGNGARFTSRDCGLEAAGIKQRGSGREWFAGDGKISRLTGSKASARKAASAHIAKIPLPLARWIARAWAEEKPAPALTAVRY